MLAVGQGIALPRGPRPRAAPVPLDVSKTLERLLTIAELDIVHVHDPFAPSTVLDRASLLAHAQRRQLPRADRARPLDPGRAAAGRDLLRPPRRAHGVDARARWSCSSGSSRARTTSSSRVPTGRAPSGHVGVAERAGRGRCGSPTARRGAGRDAALPARPAPARARPRVGGGDLARLGRAAAGDPAGAARPGQAVRARGTASRRS